MSKKFNISEFLDSLKPDRYAGVMALFDVLRSGPEAREVLSIESVTQDSGLIVAVIKFIDGKTYQVEIGEVPSE